MRKTKIRTPQTYFDWSIFPAETYRGPDNSFPWKTRIILGNACNEITLDAAQAFINAYKGHGVLDPENDGFRVQIQEHIMVGDKKIELTENNLCLHMSYFDQDDKYLVLSLLTEPVPH